MFKVFEKYLCGWVDISDEELEIIRAASVEKSLRKWQSILHDDEVLSRTSRTAKPADQSSAGFA